MAKKKPKPDGKGKGKGPKPPPTSPGAVPPPEVIAGMLRHFGGAPGQRQRTETPLERAQEKMYEAAEARTPAQQLKLAREALAISPDCADAHTLLAELAPARKAALAHYRDAVAAGERAIGPKAFQDDVGHFWGVLETRPYMRARLGLADLLWTLGERDEAVAHLRDMLRLNPNDNQGVRYTLAGFLLFLDRDDDLNRLIDQYPEDGSAAWAYTRALLAFRKGGDTGEARKLLKAAVKVNRHVPGYLTGQNQPPSEQPEYYSPGDENEAIEYVWGFLAGWKYTAGAGAWVRANTATTRPAPKAKGPSPAMKKTLGKLPQTADVWLVDFRAMPNWLETDDGPIRPTMVLAVGNTDQAVLGHEITEGEADANALWDTLAQAIRRPAAGKPHRPTAIRVRGDDRWEALRPHLKELGIELEVGADLGPLERIFSLVAESVCGEARPGILGMPGMTPERVASFYAAAAEFVNQSPWKRVGFESAVKVECARFDSGPWYAVLMGQSGLTAGVALHEDLGQLRRMWERNSPDEENAQEAVGLTVIFGEAWDVSTTDLDASKAHGWPVARPDAYPEAFRKERGMSMRPPLTWELELLEACLRALPDFVRRRKQDDPAREEFTVPTGGGELKLTLAWVAEE